MINSMKDNHLKGWLEEERKKEREEAAAYQNTLAEGVTTGTDGTGGEGTEEIREKTPAESSN